MDIQSVERALDMARKHGGFEAEFEALQDIVTALMMRYHVFGDGLDQEFYSWYLEYLLKLHDEIEKQKIAAGIPYQIKKFGNTILARIRAILDSLPEMEVTADGRSR